ncbi:MAG: hypothetical protein INR64_06765, partial [Caulobacteraceae bacterium]|nr:hypothetical protein [Caulobacter sp.]
ADQLKPASTNDFGLELDFDELTEDEQQDGSDAYERELQAKAAELGAELALSGLALDPEAAVQRGAAAP